MYFLDFPPSSSLGSQSAKPFFRYATDILLAKLSDFKQFAYRDQFTLADIAAILNLPVVRSVGNRFLGEDPLSNVAGLDEYCARMEEREHVKRIRGDAAADQVGFMTHLKELYSL